MPFFYGQTRPIDAEFFSKGLMLLPNAAISRAVCDGRLHDIMGGTTIHANGQRVQRRSAWPC